MTELPRKITDDPYGAASLIRRLVIEQGMAYWRRYAVAFTLMAVSAGTTAASAYLLGAVMNEAYVERSVRGIVILSFVIIVLFTIKGASTYGHSVILSTLGKFSNRGGSISNLTFSLSTQIGSFKGSFRHPVTARTTKYSGVFLRNKNLGGGLFLGTNQGGILRLQDDPQ